MSALPGSKRSLATRAVLWGVFLLVVWNVGRALALWRQADWLIDLSQTPDSRIRLVIALGWAVLFVIAFFGLWRWKSWSHILIPILLLLYGVYEVGMIIAYASNPPALLPVLVYALFIGFTMWKLWRPSAGPLFHSR